MKILLVAPQSAIFPVGIAYISASLKHAGHDVDCCIFDKPDDLIERLWQKYDFVATGGLSSQFIQLKHITDIGKKTNTKLIVGGGIITSEPELMSRALNGDYEVMGEGEETIIELLSCLENNGDLSRIDGIGYFEHGKFILNGRRKPIENLDSLPWPDYDGFEFHRMLDSMKPTDMYYYDVFDYPREYPIITSRSCPFLCTFCYHPLGNKYRQRSVDSIMQELETAIPKYRINIVAIHDELFSYNEKRVYEFCRRFREFTDTLPWEVKWFCQMRVDRLKDSMLDTMRESGCFLISYGFESYSPTVLRSMKKHIYPEQIHRAVHATLDRGTAIQANFIFGDKAETLQTAQETLDFWKDHLEAGIALFFIFACPNSEMYQYCIKKGIIKDKLDFIANHLFDVLNMTAMSDADFFKLRTTVAKYISKYSVQSVPLKRTLTSVTTRCPYCKEIIEYGNLITKRVFYIRQVSCRNCRKRYFIVSRLYRLYTKSFALMVTPLTYRIYVALKKVRSVVRNLSTSEDGH